MNIIKKTMFAGVIIAGLISLIFTGSSAGEIKAVTGASADSSKVAQVKSTALPKLLDLGSKSCIPCKKMAPILDSLREEYKGRAEIAFIDTRENRKAAADYKITLIPTQIFFDTLGAEVFRHIGFYSADSIVAHLRDLGVKK
jgi:thioredoxin 1